MIIIKYYDSQGKLKILRNSKNENNKTTIRFKVFENGREFPCCDFEGECTNKAYVEVYPFLIKHNKKKGWSYLCKKHFEWEQKRFKGKLPYCLSVEW